MITATAQKRQFCRKGIHTCIPAVTLTFDGGARRLHWCAEHAADAKQYRDSSDQRIAPGLSADEGPDHLVGCETESGITTCASGCPRFAAIKKTAVPNCPDLCPKCGADLRSEGYPLGHQTDEGNVCTFKWAPGNPFDYDED